MDIEDYRYEYLLTGMATGPATPEQIAAIERRLGLNLPIAYQAYLRVCGTHPPKKLIGSDCMLNQLEDLQEWARELLAENSLDIAEAYFVFLMHQGYSFLYFPLDGSPDPPVYSYHEGDNAVQKVSDRFSLWVLTLSN